MTKKPYTLVLLLTMLIYAIPALSLARSTGTAKAGKSNSMATKFSSTKPSSKTSLRVAAKPSTKASKRKKAKPAQMALINSRNYMWQEPWFDKKAYKESTAAPIREAFDSGESQKYSPLQLLKAGVFTYYPLSGGIFKRTEKVKHIIVHSTETAREADAKRIIKSWNIRGLRHSGAQFVVDRDGIIYETVDPKYAAVHVDIHKTKYGVNNHNSIGIEIVRTGDQAYTEPQMDSVAKLVWYLEERYNVPRDQVMAHGYVQPSDRSDPVAFDWHRLNFNLAFLKTGQTTALKPRAPGAESKTGA